MSAPENPPAFPSAEVRVDGMGISEGFPGMTLRDWFAGQVLAGTQANEAIRVFLASGEPGQIYVRMADRCYQIADAMLAERTKVQS